MASGYSVLQECHNQTWALPIGFISATECPVAVLCPHDAELAASHVEQLVLRSEALAH